MSRRRTNGTVTRIMPKKDCPLCGAPMILKRSDVVVHVPGNPRPTTMPGAEWICPECDYFEETDEEST